MGNTEQNLGEKKGGEKPPPQRLPAPVGEYFKQDHEALYQQYSKTTTRRVLRVGDFELEMLLEKSNIE